MADQAVDAHQQALRAGIMSALQPIAAAVYGALPDGGIDVFAEAVTYVLSEWGKEAGRDVVHEWRVTGQPDGGYPPYDFTWRSDDARWSGPEAEVTARTFIARTTAGWDDVQLRHRVVITSGWDDVTDA